MKDHKDYNMLAKMGYGVILKLPSYIVLQHPVTFDTVFFVNQKTFKGTSVQFLAEYCIPGLSNDPDVVIPAGMWREIVKKLVGNTLGDWEVRPPTRTPTQRYYTTTINPNAEFNDTNMTFELPTRQERI